MRRLISLALLVVLAIPAGASVQVTVERLEQALAAANAAHRTDADITQQLSGMELIERLSMAVQVRLGAALPGEKARQALVALADSSQFLDPPAAEIPADPMPEPAALRPMLVAVVNYVNTNVRQLPNFIATRETTGFEDRPQEDLTGETGFVNLIYLPLRVVSSSSVVVTFRDGHEVVEEAAAKGKNGGAQAQGLATEGAFGPILSTVVGDALKGKITWGRWEQGASGKQAVFRFAVPKDKSHYAVGFCCVSGGNDPGSQERSKWRTFSEMVAYHGEIAFDPASGAILRITLVAEMLPGEVVSKSQVMVEYGTVEIGEKNCICPIRSVSILSAHSTQPAMGKQSVASYKGPAKIYLNDVAFGHYRRFGSETRILAGEIAEPAGNPPVPAAGTAVSTSQPAAPVASAGSPKAVETSAAPAPAVETASTPVAVAPSVPPSAQASAQAEPEISLGTASGLPDRPASPALAETSGITLRITSRLVDVGLVVYGKNGHPVTGLKAEDFEVYDNGRKQEIRFFSEVASEVAAQAPAAQATSETPQRSFSNRAGDAVAGAAATPEAEAGATILLLDASHIAWSDLSNARRQILAFLAAAPPGERIGLYTMSSFDFRVLAEISTSHAELIARLNQWMPTAQSVSQAQEEETRNRQQFNEVHHVADLNSVNGNRNDLPDGMTSTDSQLLTEGSNPARASLVILAGVARRLAAVPGHKNLVWVSSDNVFADFSDQEVGIDKGGKYLDGYALRAQEAMNDAHVAVYPMDVSQLETAAIGADIQHRNVELTPAARDAAGNLPNDFTGGRITAAMHQDIHPIQWPVRQVAEATGGRIIRRSGDLAAALSEIVEDGRAAYQLSFSPQGPADGQYHAITVKLSARQRGLTLRYRTGYLYTREPATLKERFHEAVWRPVDANELALTAKVVLADTGANLQINIAAGDLSLVRQADRWTDKLDVFFIQRDDAGLHAQVEGKTLGLRLMPSTYQRLLPTGISFEHFVHLQPETASLRVVVVDENSGRMGSVTIPAPAMEAAR
jgi:VWFA-related protein